MCRAALRTAAISPTAEIQTSRVLVVCAHANASWPLGKHTVTLTATNTDQSPRCLSDPKRTSSAQVSINVYAAPTVTLTAAEGPATGVCSNAGVVSARFNYFIRAYKGGGPVQFAMQPSASSASVACTAFLLRKYSKHEEW